MAVVASPYALASLAETRLFMGYDVGEVLERNDTIQRAINGASIAILRRSQRWFTVPAAWQDLTKPRWTRIADSDIRRGYVRIGDMHAAPAEAAILSPDRNGSSDPNVLDAGDWWALPDTPEPGMPFESINIVSTAGPLTTGWWLRVKSIHWGFESIPEDMIEATVACAAAFVLNDPVKQSAMARETGRRLTISNIILPEWEDTIDEYRIYRVS